MSACRFSAEARLLFAGFNQDSSCFSTGLDDGYRIFTCDTVHEQVRNEFPGGIGCIQMLFRSNYVAMIGGGKIPAFPPTSVVIWDDVSKKVVIQIDFAQEVKGVRLRRDRILALLKNKVYIYTFGRNPALMQKFDTAENEKGLAALCALATNPVVAFPALQPGHIQVANIGDERRFSMIIPAHKSLLGCLAMNQEGTRIASASEKGTLIRVFDVAKGMLLHELRRGSDRADINSIDFNMEGTLLCCSSDKGTIHVFRLERLEGSSRTSTPTEGFSITDMLPKYFNSAWSFAKFHTTDVMSICTFTGDGQGITAVCSNGMIYKVRFDMRRGGEGQIEFECNFLSLGSS